jgi:hypothetical protein
MHTLQFLSFPTTIAGWDWGSRGGVKNSVAKVEEIMRILTFKNFFLWYVIIFKCQGKLE